MNHKELETALRDYAERWPAEAGVVARFQELAATWPQCLHRDHMPGHLTASGWVVHEASACVLLTHHRKLDKWLQLGGHADGEEDLLAAAAREVVEESGLECFSTVRPGGALFDIDIHAIPPHGTVPEHFHYDIRFLFAADVAADPVISDESHDVAWVRADDLERYTQEPSMLRMRDKWLAWRVTAEG